MGNLGEVKSPSDRMGKEKLKRRGLIMQLSVFPVKLVKEGDKLKKKAAIKGWKDHKPTPEQLAEYTAPGRNFGVAVPDCVLIIDLDLHKGVTRVKVEEALGCKLKWGKAHLQTTVRGGHHYAFYHPLASSLKHGADLFGVEGFDTRTPVHTYIASGEGYEGDVLTPLSEPKSLPRLPDRAFNSFTTSPKADDLDELSSMIDAQPVDWTKEEVKQAVLEQMPVLESYYDWLNVGMALHHQYKGQRFGVKLWDAYSQQCENYDIQEIKSKYASFTTSSNPITFKSLIHLYSLSRASRIDVESDNGLLTTLDMDFLNTPPEKTKYIGGRFPVGYTSAVVAMGGAGKTQWLTREALKLASNGVKTLFVSAEDGPKNYQNKVYNAVRAPDVSFNFQDLLGNIQFLDLRGKGSKLVTENKGSFVPGDSVKDIKKVAKNFDADLVIFETLSRFAGGEENERFEATISACDAIAMSCEAAVVLVHHTGKSQAREKVIDLYSGRGGSVLGDNTRSMTVLTTLDEDYQGVGNVLYDVEDLLKGLVFEVTHVRSSYAKALDPEYYVKRSGECNGPIIVQLDVGTEEQMRELAIAKASERDAQIMTKIVECIKAEGGQVMRSYFDRDTKAKIGCGQKDGRAVVEIMIDRGMITESQVPGEGRQKRKILALNSEVQGS